MRSIHTVNACVNKATLQCFPLVSVTVSVLSIEGTDCRLDELGRLADRTGGKVRRRFHSVDNTNVQWPHCGCC